MDSTQRWDRLAAQTGTAGIAGTVLLFAPVIAVSGLGKPPLRADEQEARVGKRHGGRVGGPFVWISEAWLVPYTAFWVWFLAECIHLLRKPGSLSAATP